MSDIKTEQKQLALPSTSPFKYVMDLPILSEWNTNAGDMLKIASDKLNVKEDEVYFTSTDCSPVLQLNWKELLENANEIFNDNCISLIFTDKNQNWIIFRSIENEWRCGNKLN